MELNEQERWADLDSVLTRGGPLAHPAFDASTAKESLFSKMKILVIGAGGLGCEILKDLALSGFRDIHVIDLDTIELSNLNRQFLFRESDVGSPKASTAARFVMERVPLCKVTPHFCRIEDFEPSFYADFNLIVVGLDSIDARRWLNSTVVSLCTVNDDGEPEGLIPLIDGGSEGFKGQARVILPKVNACFECTLGLFPPRQNFPFCTIANTPRIPEHCIEYASQIQWGSLKPFGEGVKLDGDNPEHVQWTFEKAKERGANFKIPGVTYRLTQGVVKRIIPAIASTNALIAAACCNEALKCATSCSFQLSDYFMYFGIEGIYTHTYENLRKEDCPVCGKPNPIPFSANKEDTLEEFIEILCNDQEVLRVKEPSLRSCGKNLFMQAPPMLFEATKENLKKTMGQLFQELKFEDGVIVCVADKKLPFVMDVAVTLDAPKYEPPEKV